MPSNGNFKCNFQSVNFGFTLFWGSEVTRFSCTVCIHLFHRILASFRMYQSRLHLALNFGIFRDPLVGLASDLVFRSSKTLMIRKRIPSQGISKASLVCFKPFYVFKADTERDKWKCKQLLPINLDPIDRIEFIFGHLKCLMHGKDGNTKLSRMK